MAIFGREDIEHAWQMLNNLGGETLSPSYRGQLRTVLEVLGIDPTDADDVASEWLERAGSDRPLDALLEGMVVGVVLGRGARQPAPA